MTKRQRSGFFVLAILIIVTEIVIQLYPNFVEQRDQVEFTPTEEALLLKVNKSHLDDKTNVETNIKVELSPFNPNALDEKGFIRLGFSQKQAKTLLKYRYSLGGNFSSIEEFGQSYVVSERKLAELRPYIKLAPIAQNNINSRNNTYKKDSKSFTKQSLKPFYPNKLNHAQWMKIGFTERQANVILNFKNSLPNQRFQSAEQIHSCYAINDYMFDKIKNYIRFEETNLKDKRVVLDKPLTTYHVNQMHPKDWVDLGFTMDEANGIKKYIEFKDGVQSLKELSECKFITEDQLSQIEDRLLFE